MPASSCLRLQTTHKMLAGCRAALQDQTAYVEAGLRFASGHNRPGPRREHACAAGAACNNRSPTQACKQPEGEQMRTQGLTGRAAQVEFILMGGTFMSLPTEYRDWFIRGLHDALSGHASSSAAEAVAFAEQARTKCIGLTIETRPDYCLTPHLTQARPADPAWPARGGCGEAAVCTCAPEALPLQELAASGAGAGSMAWCLLGGCCS